MKKANLVLMAALAAAGVVGVVGASLMPATAIAAEKKPTLSDKVRKPLVAAQESMKTEKWNEAATHIQEALAVEGRTPYDDFVINDFAWRIYLKQGKLAESADALEKALATGQTPPENQTQYLKTLTQINLQKRDFPKAVEAGKKYLAANPADREVALQMCQAMYLMKDFAGAKAAAEKLAAESSPPAEQVLTLLLRINYDAKDAAGTTHSLESLVRYYPKQTYWKDLLNDQLFRTRDERALRALYRLMSDTNTLDKGEDYAEMGTMLIAGGFPTEAKQILERGLSANLLQGPAKDRAQADLATATKSAAADAKDLPGAEKALASAKSGNEMVAIGKLYFSTGDHAKAAAAIEKGLAAGGVKDPDDAHLLLGIAYARAGDSAKAGAALDAVKDAQLTDLAHLWKLKLEVAGKSAG